MKIDDLDDAVRHAGSRSAPRAARGRRPEPRHFLFGEGLDVGRDFQLVVLPEIAHLDAARDDQRRVWPCAAELGHALRDQRRHGRRPRVRDRSAASSAAAVRCRSTRASVMMKPKAENWPGWFGTSPRGMPASAIRSLMCGGPAPPKATSVKSRGSRPRSISTLAQRADHVVVGDADDRRAPSSPTSMAKIGRRPAATARARRRRRRASSCRRGSWSGSIRPSTTLASVTVGRAAAAAVAGRAGHWRRRSAGRPAACRPRRSRRSSRRRRRSVRMSSIGTWIGRPHSISKSVVKVLPADHDGRDSRSRCRPCRASPDWSMPSQLGHVAGARSRRPPGPETATWIGASAAASSVISPPFDLMTTTLAPKLARSSGDALIERQLPADHRLEIGVGRSWSRRAHTPSISAAPRRRSRPACRAHSSAKILVDAQLVLRRDDRRAAGRRRPPRSRPWRRWRRPAPAPAPRRASRSRRRRGSIRSFDLEALWRLTSGFGFTQLMS